MSYFLVTTGAVPPLGDTTEVQLVPVATAQAYVSRIAAEWFDEDDRGKTFLVDDGTSTTDKLVQDAAERMNEGVPFESTSMGIVLLRLTEKGCALRIWWASGPESHRDLDVFDESKAFLRAVQDRLARGADINALYRPPSR